MPGCNPNQIRGCVSVPYAINFGGTDYIDDAGVRYIKDPYPIQTPPTYSDIDFCGDRSPIWGSSRKNYFLFRTFRRLAKQYCFSLPIPKDGRYTLVIKMTEPGYLKNHTIGRDCDVHLNGILIKKNVNVLKSVEYWARYDLVTNFNVNNNVKILAVDGQTKTATIKGNRIHLQFNKTSPGNYDYILVSAIYLANYTGKFELLNLKTEGSHCLTTCYKALFRVFIGCNNSWKRRECHRGGCLYNPHKTKGYCRYQPEIACSKYSLTIVLAINRIYLPPDF